MSNAALCKHLAEKDLRKTKMLIASNSKNLLQKKSRLCIDTLPAVSQKTQPVYRHASCGLTKPNDIQRIRNPKVCDLWCEGFAPACKRSPSTAADKRRVTRSLFLDVQKMRDLLVITEDVDDLRIFKTLQYLSVYRSSGGRRGTKNALPFICRDLGRA